jgi:hypothetical protein
MGEGMRNLNEVESGVAQIGSFWWAVADLQDYRPRGGDNPCHVYIVSDFGDYITASRKPPEMKKPVTTLPRKPNLSNNGCV